MDRLTTMRVFARVAETGSFTKAALGLNLPRATVSAAIQAVEVQAGTRLLNRTTRRVALTVDGAAYLERCLRLLDDVDDMDLLFRQERELPRGRLKVSLPERLANHTLIPALPAFLARYPALSLELGVSDRYVDLVQDGIDCVIRGGDLKDSRLIGRRLGEIVQGSFASPDYLARHGWPVQPSDLGQHRVIGYVAPSSGGADFSWKYQESGTVKSIPAPSPLAVDNAETQVMAAKAGLGIIQVPVYGVQPLINAGVLKEILTDFRPPPLALSVLYPHRRHRSPKLSVFVAWVEQVLAEAGVFRR